jgi:hypothetical protein
MTTKQTKRIHPITGNTHSKDTPVKTGIKSPTSIVSLSPTDLDMNVTQLDNRCDAVLCSGMSLKNININIISNNFKGM